MPRKFEIELFSFDELSKKAKARAIKDFADDPERTWDYDDSERLTEMFEQDLEDHYGLGEFKVNWSLGYCQGDGVCFQGTVNIERFIKTQEVEKRFERILRLAEIGEIGAKITHKHPYCHWNSMNVEVELYLREYDLLPKDLYRKVREWEGERDRIVNDWNRARSEVIERNMAPVREWEAKTEKFKRGPQGPREWTPRGPGRKPELLNYPIPPEPVIPEPDWFKEAQARMAAEYAEVERETKEFEKYLDERVKGISQEMEKSGYEEIEYHRTDDYITELLENRDYEYTKDGERWKR